MKKWRVCVIGTGMIANCAHFPALNLLKEKGYVEIIAVADIRLEAARETARRHGVELYFEDPQEMLNQCHPDFVAVCTPNRYHKKWTIAALRAGAHVACEKPMALTKKDAEEMWETAKQCGKKLFPCQCMRWRNYMQQSKHLIEQGNIGVPYFADVEFIRRIGVPTWGMFHMKEHNFGGPFCDLGVHLIDSLLWLCGDQKIQSVSGSTYKKIANQGNAPLLDIAESGAYAGVFTPRPYSYQEFDVEDLAVGYIRLKSGMSINFKFSWAVYLPTTNLDLRICGDKGGLSVNKEMLYHDIGGYQAETKLKWFDNGQYRGVPFEQHRYMYENIFQTLNGETEYLITEKQNLEVTKAIECFYRSAETGKEIYSEELED